MCIVVTFQQSSAMLDTSPIHPPSSAVRPAPIRHSSRLPSVLSQALCLGGLHTAHLSWRHRGPICQDGACVWCRGHVSGFLPSSVWAQVRPGACPFVFGSSVPCNGCPRCVERRGRVTGLEHTQCSEVVAESWRLQRQGKGRQEGDPEQMLTQMPSTHWGPPEGEPAGPHSQPNTQTSVNSSCGGQEGRPDPTVPHDSVVYFNQPNNSTCVT